MISANDNAAMTTDYYRPYLNAEDARTYDEAPTDLTLAPEIKLIRTHIVKELKGAGPEAPPPNHVALVRLLTALCRVVNQQSKGSTEPANDDAWLTAAESILQENRTEIS